MEDDIFKRILQDKQFHIHTVQIRAEGNNTKCVGKKRFNGSVTHVLRKENVLRSPPFLDKVRPFIFIWLSVIHYIAVKIITNQCNQLY
jgi:5-methylcytosine-specific restriction endonuclease McrBC regulatory subunit McrC